MTDTALIANRRFFLAGAATLSATAIPANAASNDAVLQKQISSRLGSAVSPLTLMPAEVLSAVTSGTNTQDLTRYLQEAADQAAARGCELNLHGAPGGWIIRTTLDLTNVPTVIADFNCPIIADVTGDYPNGFAVTFGNPLVGAWVDRSNGLNILGTLRVSANGRGRALNGIYLKGSYHNVNYIYATGFAGTGIYLDAVWDSFYGRIGADQCGHPTETDAVGSYAIVLSSKDDSQNTTTICSLQCESAYQRGIYANLLRYVLIGIHAERLAIIHPGDLNHYFLVSNTTVMQGCFDARTPSRSPEGRAADGTSLATGAMRVKLNGDASSYNEMHFQHTDVRVDYGTGLNFTNLVCDNLTVVSPSSRIVFTLLVAGGACSLEQNVTLIEPAIATFLPTLNAKNLIVRGGTITRPIDFAEAIQGNILFDGVVITEVQNTGRPATGFLSAQFVNCNIGKYTGAFNSTSKVKGGYVGTVALTSQAQPDFDGTHFGSFGYRGDPGFLTRNCRCDGDATWNTPAKVNYPAGTLTERVGYDAAGKFYQNTNGAAAWAVI